MPGQCGFWADWLKRRRLLAVDFWIKRTRFATNRSPLFILRLFHQTRLLPIFAVRDGLVSCMLCFVNLISLGAIHEVAKVNGLILPKHDAFLVVTINT